MKNLLSLLLPIVVATGCASIHDKDSRRPLEYTSTLRVNSENKVRFYSHKSEKEGILDLYNSLDSAPSEDCYAHADGVWLELGFNEKTEKRSSTIVHDNLKINWDKLLEFGNGKTNVSGFHIHRVQEDISDKDSVYKIAFPSPTDIDYLLSANKSLIEEDRSFCIQQGVVSRYGVTTYALTDKCKKRIKNNSSGFGSLMLPDYLLFNNMPGDIALDMLNQFIDIRETNSRLKKRVSFQLLEGLVDISFTPIAEFKQRE